MTWLALGRALSGLVHVRLLVLFWLSSVVFAALVAVPFGTLLDDSVERLPDPQAKAARVGQPWYDDFRRANAPALDTLAGVAGGVAWLHALFAGVLAGGVVAAFDRRARAKRREEGRGWSYRTFFADAGRWAWPMLRLFLLSLPLFYLVDLAVGDGLAKLFDRVFADHESERLEVFARWWREVILLVLLWIVATWFDLARARLVVERRRSALLALSAAASTIIARPGPVVAVSLTFVVLELALMRGGAWAGSLVETSSWTRIGIWLLMTQVLVLLRFGCGFARLARSPLSARRAFTPEREARVHP